MINLINRQDAIDAINNHFGFNIEEEYGSAVQEVINGLPSAEARIIHCKDCKWWDREAEDSPMGYCHACKHGHYSRHWEIRIIRTYEEDFFCADAEPKEEGEDEDE